MNKFIKFIEHPASLLLIYLFMFVFTFGYSFNQVPNEETRYFGSTSYTVHHGSGEKAFHAFFSSTFWPLYWSVVAWEK